MSQFLTNPPFQRVTGAAIKPWRLHSDLVYESDLLGYTITVPSGYRTDFASVPWFFRRLFPQAGPWTLAAVVHDRLCDARDPEINSKLSAQVFSEAMAVLGVPNWKRKAMYKAVLWMGPRWP